MSDSYRCDSAGLCSPSNLAGTSWDRGVEYMTCAGLLLFVAVLEMARSRLDVASAASSIISRASYWHVITKAENLTRCFLFLEPGLCNREKEGALQVVLLAMTTYWV
jgi:hypothetical protein